VGEYIGELKEIDRNSCRATRAIGCAEARSASIASDASPSVAHSIRFINLPDITIKGMRRSLAVLKVCFLIGVGCFVWLLSAVCYLGIA